MVVWRDDWVPSLRVAFGMATALASKQVWRMENIRLKFKIFCNLCDVNVAKIII